MRHETSAACFPAHFCITVDMNSPIGNAVWGLGTTTVQSVLLCMELNCQSVPADKPWRLMFHASCRMPLHWSPSQNAGYRVTTWRLRALIISDSYHFALPSFIINRNCLNLLLVKKTKGLTANATFRKSYDTPDVTYSSLLIRWVTCNWNWAPAVVYLQRTERLRKLSSSVRLVSFLFFCLFSNWYVAVMDKSAQQYWPIHTFSYVISTSSSLWFTVLISTFEVR